MNIMPLPENDRLSASSIIFECFKPEYKNICPDKSKVIRAISSMLTNRFFALYINGEIAGVLGYATSEGRATRFVFSAYKELFGLPKACLAWLDFLWDTTFLGKKSIKNGEAILLEFIATAPHFRGRGVATALIEYALNNLPTGYQSGGTRFEIEVFEANPAINLYKKLGFVQVGRRRVLRKPNKNYTHMARLSYHKNKQGS